MDSLTLTFGKLMESAGNLIKIDSLAGSFFVIVIALVIAFSIVIPVWSKAKTGLKKIFALIVTILVFGLAGYLTAGQIANIMELTEGKGFIEILQDTMNDEDSDVGGFDFTPNEGFFN